MSEYDDNNKERDTYFDALERILYSNKLDLVKEIAADALDVDVEEYINLDDAAVADLMDEDDFDEFDDLKELDFGG